jgi:hypothetical protein
VLARVITRLGSVDDVNTGVIERLFASDLAYLQHLYERFNSSEAAEPSATAAKGPRRMAAVGEA